MYAACQPLLMGGDGAIHQVVQVTSLKVQATQRETNIPSQRAPVLWSFLSPAVSLQSFSSCPVPVKAYEACTGLFYSFCSWNQITVSEKVCLHLKGEGLQAGVTHF